MRVLPLLLPLAACAADPRPPRGGDVGTADITADEQAAVDRELAGLTPGTPGTCLPPVAGRSASSRIYGRTIIYTVTGSLKYRSDAPSRCSSGRGPDADVLVTTTPIGRSCSGDPVQVLDRYTGVLRGVCSLGPFVPYTRR